MDPARCYRVVAVCVWFGCLVVWRGPSTAGATAAVPLSVLWRDECACRACCALVASSAVCVCGHRPDADDDDTRGTSTGRAHRSERPRHTQRTGNSAGQRSDSHRTGAGPDRTDGRLWQLWLLWLRLLLLLL